MADLLLSTRRVTTDTAWWWWAAEEGTRVVAVGRWRGGVGSEVRGRKGKEVENWGRNAVVLLINFVAIY